jgi:hypothetical protein
LLKIIVLQGTGYTCKSRSCRGQRDGRHHTAERTLAADWLYRQASLHSRQIMSLLPQPHTAVAL